jgi:hypothetical protein
VGWIHVASLLTCDDHTDSIKSGKFFDKVSDSQLFRNLHCRVPV